MFFLSMCFLQCSCVSLAHRSVCKLLFFPCFQVFILHLPSLQQGLSNLRVGTVPSEQTGRSGDRQKIIWSSRLKSVVLNLIKWHGFFSINVLCFALVLFFCWLSFFNIKFRKSFLNSITGQPLTRLTVMLHPE